MEDRKSGETGKVGFMITGGKGFHITFENGVTASVQFGYANYCENKEFSLNYHAELDIIKKEGGYFCPNAEVAAWDKDGRWVTKDVIQTGEDVAGWINPKGVLAFLIKCAKLK